MVSLNYIISNLAALFLLLLKDDDSLSSLKEFLSNTYHAAIADLREGPIAQNKDYLLSVEEMVKGYGYEEHIVESQGYNLMMYHIWNKTSPNGEPVIMMHGLMDQASTWFIAPHSTNLAFHLLKDGY